MTRPRILLIPSLTEIEWSIKPQLETWADVASFDVPGVGEEPRAETFGREAVVQRTLAELDRRGWDSCLICCDSFGIPTGIRVAAAWPGQVTGIALGHARLSTRTGGDRPPVSKGVLEAMLQLLRSDDSAIVRHGLAQFTHGSLGDELTQQWIERVPLDLAQEGLEQVMADPESIEVPLRELGLPLLLVKHEDCLGVTEEGWEDAVAAFPEARTLSVAEAPTVSADFAGALRSFYLEAAETTPGATP
jgi:hypothetical protein